jgi:4-amino-4-deoxy-L-arabinose transferase-like glycosyltransferase
MKTKNWLFLLLILIVALFFRVYKITKVPPSLNWDEVSIGYNAYSILKTGKDEWGKTLPLHFESYGEYKLPLQIYASIPAIAIFGLNPFGVRVTPAIYGVLTVLFFYFFVLELIKDRRIALVSSLLLAISPWHIQLTRASFESSFSLMWVILGGWMFLRGVNRQKIKYFVLSAVLFGISVYTYNAARVFSPLFLFFISVFYFVKRKISFKQLFFSFAVFAMLLLPLIPFVLSGEAAARYKLVSITTEAGLIPRINERRGLSKLPKPLPRLIHNKVTYITYYFVNNFVSHFSPNFLFIKGASHRQHSVQGMGELYVFQAPLLLLGLYFLFRKIDLKGINWFIFSWLIISLIPVSTTRDSIPNALRTIIANPIFQVISAVGFIYFWDSLKGKKQKQILGIFLALMVTIEVFRFSDLLFKKYSLNYSRDWQYGYKEAVDYIKSNSDRYDMVVFTRYYGEPHMFTLFYLNYPPENYMNNPSLVRYKAYDWVWVTRFDKYYFPNLSDKGTGYGDIITENPGKKILFIGRSEDIPNSVQRLKTINFLDGKRVFDIVESI